MAAFDQLVEILDKAQKEIIVLMLMQSDDDDSTWDLADSTKTYLEDILIPCMDVILDQDRDAPAKLSDIKHLERAWDLSCTQHHVDNSSSDAKTKMQNSIDRLKDLMRNAYKNYPKYPVSDEHGA
jgi:hypothetical protein